MSDRWRDAARGGLLVTMVAVGLACASAQMVQIEGVPFMATQVITRTTPGGTTRTEGKVARNGAGSTYVEEVDPVSGAARRAFIFDVPAKRVITLDLARRRYSVRSAPLLEARRVPLGWVGDQLRWAEVHRDRSLRAVEGGLRATQTWLGTRQVSGLVTVGTLAERRVPGADVPAVEVAESWYSVELGMSVLMTESKPRVGDVTEVMLTKILRTEPEAQLFEVPRDFAPEDAGVVGALAPPVEGL